jgi:uroporphyrinogen decarboxylase
MNGRQRIVAALRGEWPDRVPVMLHNFLMAAREAGYTQRQYREDPRKIADSFIRSVEKYGYDGVLVDVDTATLADAVGVPVDFPEDEPARCTRGCLSSLAQVRDLPPPDISRHPRVQTWLEAVRLVKRHFGGDVYLRGNCDQDPYSLAASMRGAADWMMDLKDPDQHEDAFRLLDYCAGVTCQFLRLMAGTGADMLSNGDSLAGPDVVSPAFYRQFAQAWERKVADQSHALGLPYVLHVCGRTDRILGDMLETGADGLELDYKTDVRVIHAKLKDRAVFIGNIDPSGVLALGTPALVERKTRELLEVYADSPRFILNAGCAIPATTPPENLRTMIRVARECRP